MCPPHTDQTTRGPQRWQFIAPRLRQSQKLLNEHGWRTNTPRELFSDPDKTWGAWGKLARPIQPSSSASRANAILGARSKLDPRARNLNSTCDLVNLPFELQHQVISSLGDSKTDILALALTCTRLLSVVSSYITMAQVKASAPWAGIEIACTGTYLVDLPEPFEKNDLALKSVERTDGPLRMCMARRIHWSAWSEYKAYDGDEEGAKAWSKALEAHGQRAAGIPTKQWEAIDAQISGSAGLFPKDADFILRNLDTKEFVCCRPGKNGQGHVRNTCANLEWLTIDSVLLRRITWTGIEMRYPQQNKPQDWRKGVWAGHRFDIVPAKTHEAECQGQELWKDVTRVVAEEAAAATKESLKEARHE